MSLYLPEQKLGSHSVEGASSNKFILKGRQTGSMHRGHTWVFRAESYDTMLAWYDDIKAMTERSPEERNNFLRGHARSISRSSQRSSLSSDGVDDDEDPPFASVTVATNPNSKHDVSQRRPSGGRFPSDLQVNAQRGLQVPLSPLSVSSGYNEDANGDAIATANVPPAGYGPQPYTLQESGSVGETGREGRNGMYPLLIHPDTMATNSVNRAGKSIYSVSHAPAGTGNIPGASYADGNEGNSLEQLGDERSARVNSAQARHVPDIGDGVRSTRVGLHAITVSSVPGQTPPLEADRYRPIDGESRAAGVRDNFMDGATNGAAYLEGRPLRPGGGAARNDSIPTISHLHIPGEYPKGATSGLS